MGKTIAPSSHVPSGTFVQYAGHQDRAVMLYSWWHSKKGRKFCVVEKVTTGQGFEFKTVGIRLLEVDDSNTFYRDIAEFWNLVDRGSLTEHVHNALEGETDIN